MREDYLHHLFNTKRLGNSFRTTTGSELTVQKFGILNPNAGPDFPDSQIMLDDMAWAGPIEFHVRSSDWYVHGHQHDMHYNNVIAHFVYENDRDVEINGQKIPTVELKERIDWNHYKKFTSLTESSTPIACATGLKRVSSLHVVQQKERALISRLMRKTEHILAELKRFKGDREKVFYLLLARVFGGQVNAAAFETLIEKLDLNALRKLPADETAVPAVVLGMSGLLPEISDDEYVNRLIVEFAFQKHRLQLNPVNGSAFRFSRMHPPGFPTLRLAQLAALLEKRIAPGDLISQQVSLSDIRRAFVVDIPVFWQTHYRFEKPGQLHEAGITDAFTDLIIINVVVPYLFAVGELTDDDNLKQHALDLLGNIHPENNTIIRSWKALGIEAESAFDTQALIEQKNEFCSKKKCLFCNIGNQLLKP